MKIISLPENVRLPAGYRFGAHWNNSRGRSGYYLIRESDDAALQCELRPDLTQAEDDEVDEDDFHTKTTSEVLEAIESGFNGDG